MQAARKVAINTGFLYARMGITVLISLYSTRLILEELGPVDFGIFNLVAGSIAMLGFLNASMAAATQRYFSFAQGLGNLEKIKEIFNVSIVLHLAIAGILLIILEAAGYFFFNHILNIEANRLEVAKLVYQFMVVSTIFTVISVPYDAVINAHENMLIFAIFGILETLIKLAIAIYITYTIYDHLLVFGLLTAGSSIFLLIISRIYCHLKYKECRLNLRRHFRKPLFQEMTSFAGWSFLVSFTSMTASYGQGMIMNIFFGPIVNTAQGIAAQVSGQLGAFSATMLRALNPMIAKSEGSGDRALMLKATMIGCKISFYLLLLFYIPVLIEMPYIFKLWLKNVPEYAIIFCRLLLIRNLIEQLFIPLNTSILAVGKIRKYQVFNSIITLLPLPISYIFFLYKYPPYSLYIVFIVYALLISCSILYFSKRICGLPISIFMKEIVLKCLIIFSLLIVISFSLSNILEEGILRLLVVSCTSTFFFVILVWLIGLSNKERLGLYQLGRFATKKIKIKNYKLKGKLAKV